MSDNIEVNITQGQTITAEIVQGEVTLAENVGGEKEVYKEKVNATLKFRTIKAGTNITITQNTNDLEISASGGVQSRIQDTDNDTYVDVESSADIDRIDFGSPGTGTTVIAKFISDTGGTPTDVLEIDGNGNIFNNGNYQLVVDSDNLFIGTSSTHSSASGNLRNTFAGKLSGNGITSGDDNVFIGYNTGLLNSGGSKNTFIGSLNGDLNHYTANSNVFLGFGSGRNTNNSFNTFVGTDSGRNNNGQYNSAFGYRSGYTGDGNDNIFIGTYSGYYSTESDIFLLANQQYADAATEKTNSLMYGIHGATPSAQMLRVNGTLNVNTAELTNQVAGDIQSGNSLILPEITTPTADTNYGKIYTKTDNKLYFQDGAGVEHEIAFV